MSERQGIGPELPEQRIARLFEASGYEVSQAVGLEPGVVDYFATSRGGFVRTKTYWKAWEQCPSDINAALEALEHARRARGADRGLGILMTGGLPAGYNTDLEGRTANIITYRRLVLELSDIASELREFVRQYEASQESRLYFPLRGKTREGEIVDAATYIEQWLRAPYAHNLFLQGGVPVPIRQAVVERAVYLSGLVFQHHPDETVPLVDVGIPPDEVEAEALRNGWAVPTMSFRSFSPDLSPRALITVGLGEPQVIPEKLEGDQFIELLEPEPAEVEAWYREKLHEGAREPFVSAYRQVGFFRDLVSSLVSLPEILHVMQQAPKGAQATLPEWVARVVAMYLGEALQKSTRVARLSVTLEEWAIEQFALGRFLVTGKRVHLRDAEMLLRWLKFERTQPSDEFSSFKNVMIRDYFVARRIVSEVRAGRRDILARYQFPQEYVLLFLAIIAPEVAAQVTADRGEEMRATIEGEVERRLQLTLAHMLRRSAGAVRSHLKTIKRYVPADKTISLQHEFTRIDQEISFQLALAERTRLLHEVPEEALEAISVLDVVEHITQQLQDAYPNVRCAIHIPAGVKVRAMRNGLRESLFCLLENAFQAVAFAESLKSPEVMVQVGVEGDVVRLDILDNGPGVAVEDRERIFEPHVTTKKGGGDRPMGTGMGLAIARRYAEHMGGRVGFDSGRAETCFYMQLVVWKE